MQLNLNFPKLPRRRGILSRDIVLLLVGAAGLLNEAFIENGERPTLIIAFLACMGFPVFLHTDEAHQPPEPPESPEPAQTPPVLPIPAPAPAGDDHAQ